MDTAALQQLVGGPRDNAMLRLTLARRLYDEEQINSAIDHLKQAVILQPGYSAAWKLLGKYLAENADIEEARKAFEKGIDAARSNGDKQSEKEMLVFLRRLNKKL